MKRDKILFWVFTILFCLPLTMSGFFMLLGAINGPNPEMAEGIRKIGYPLSIFWILGPLKLLGVAALLIPGYPRIKEWAYSGFTFNLLGAIVSHIAAGQALPEFIGPIILLGILGGSYYFKNRLAA